MNRKSDMEPRVLFGKTYVWLRGGVGNLCLVSIEKLNGMLDAMSRARFDG